MSYFELVTELMPTTILSWTFHNIMGFSDTKIIPLFFISLLWLIYTNGYAIDLMGVYKQALAHDPDFLMAQASRQVRAQDIAITRAGLLPSFGIQGNATYSHDNQGDVVNDGSVANYSLSLKQTLFDYGKWISYQASKDTVRSANATYAAVLQDLMVRVTGAYMDVLQAEDKLYLAKKNTKILLQIEHQTILQFKAGIKKTADVDNARAAYDSSRSSLLHAQNNVVITKTKLQAMTSIAHDDFAKIKNTFPLISPQPQNLNAWLAVVKQKNLSVIAERYAAMAAEKHIKEQRAGHYPVIKALASFSGNHSRNNGLANTNDTAASVSVNLNFPIYQGNLILAQTKQAKYEYQKATFREMKAYRTGYSEAQQTYNSIVTDINAINLERLAIASNKRSYKSTAVAYKAGTRNIIDLLTVQESLFAAQNAYIQDKYQYFKDFVALKQATGSLSVMDLQQINKWIQ